MNANHLELNNRLLLTKRSHMCQEKSFRDDFEGFVISFMVNILN